MTETKKANVLVTGAGGFIGGFLCERLVAEGHAVTALAMGNENTERLKSFGCRIVRGDLNRPESISGICRGADLVFHLAARVTYWGTRNDFYSAIVDATRNLLNEASGNGCRFVFASSVVAVGLGNGHIRGQREMDPTRKTGVFYGDAKLDAENLVWQYHREGKVEGVEIMGKPIDWKTFAPVPFGLAWPMAGIVGGACATVGIRTTLTRHNVAMMGRDNDLDTTRAKADLGWTTRIPYDAAIKRIAGWMREQGLAEGTHELSEG